MARTIPPQRLEQLVECATRIFIDQGYAHAQMADIADAMGVAKGTLYLYVESKDALFDLVCRSADREQPLEMPSKLPLPTPPLSATLKHVKARLIENQKLPALAAALGRSRVADPRAEIESIVREIYRTLFRNRTGIKLMDRSAQYHPELAALWFGGARGTLVESLAGYLRRRADRKLLRPLADPIVGARVIVEMITTWAVHRFWDPAPQEIDDKVAEDTVVQFIVGGLTPTEGGEG